MRRLSRWDSEKQREAEETNESGRIKATGQAVDSRERHLIYRGQVASNNLESDVQIVTTLLF
jgi:hypothetical protein